VAVGAGLGDVGYWHETDMPGSPHNVRSWEDTVAELDETQRPDNNRIGTNTFLNQYFAVTPDLELMLLAWARKIVLQHNRG
jgi:hypothetical protein